MQPEYRWVREHGTLHIPDVREQRNDFPSVRFDQRVSYLLSRSSSSAG